MAIQKVQIPKMQTPKTVWMRWKHKNGREILCERVAYETKARLAVRNFRIFIVEAELEWNEKYRKPLCKHVKSIIEMRTDGAKELARAAEGRRERTFVLILAVVT